MNNEAFERMIQEAKRDIKDWFYYYIFTTEDHNEQWLTPMVISHFEGCSSFNPDLLSIKKIAEYDGPAEYDYDGSYPILVGIYEIHILYDDIDITKFITGEYELHGFPAPKDGGILGLAYKELKHDIVEEYLLNGVRENFKELAERGCEDYGEECLTLAADDAEECVNIELRKEFGKNVFTVCKYKSIDDLEVPYDKAEKEYEEYLIKNGYIDK